MIVGVPGCRNKPTVPVGDHCVGWWIRPLADNTILHFVRIGDWMCSTFRASNHKSTRSTPGSFASILYYSIYNNYYIYILYKLNLL